MILSPKGDIVFSKLVPSPLLVLSNLYHFSFSFIIVCRHLLAYEGTTANTRDDTHTRQCHKEAMIIFTDCCHNCNYRNDRCMIETASTVNCTTTKLITTISVFGSQALSTCILVFIGFLLKMKHPAPWQLRHN